MTYTSGSSGSLTLLGKALPAFITARNTHETDDKELIATHLDALNPKHPMTVPVSGIGEVGLSLVHRFLPDMNLVAHDILVPKLGYCIYQTLAGVPMTRARNLSAVFTSFSENLHISMVHGHSTQKKSSGLWYEK